MEINIRNKRFKIEENSHKIYWDFINSGEWENETFDVIDFFLKPDSIAFDIGAWAGPVSFYMANICQTVFAIEPDFEIYSDLKTNTALNTKLDVKHFQLAISDQNSSLQLYARKKYGQSSSSLLQRVYDKLDSEVVSAITLKEFTVQNNIERVDFIKIDTEGGEFKFIKGWSSILKQLKFPTLLISFHTNQLKEHIMLNKFRNKIIAKLILKLSNLLSFELYESVLKSEIEAAFNALNNYKYIYQTNGKEISLSEILLSSKVVGNNSFVITNTKWNV